VEEERKSERRREAKWLSDLQAILKSFQAEMGRSKLTESSMPELELAWS
jgi:hypothetical protein